MKGSFGDFEAVLSSICIQFEPRLYLDNSKIILELFNEISTLVFAQDFQHSKEFMLTYDLSCNIVVTSNSTVYDNLSCRLYGFESICC